MVKVNIANNFVKSNILYIDSLFSSTFLKVKTKSLFFNIRSYPETPSPEQVPNIFLEIYHKIQLLQKKNNTFSCHKRDHSRILLLKPSIASALILELLIIQLKVLVLGPVQNRGKGNRTRLLPIETLLICEGPCVVVHCNKHHLNQFWTYHSLLQ